MKKRIFVICVLFILIVLFSYCYKFFIPGNTKSIENVNDLNEYLSKINDYSVEAKVTVNSNKNSNSYNLKQSRIEGKCVQEISDIHNSMKVIMENTKGRVIVKNTELSLENVFNNYDDVVKNSMGLDAFIEDYESDDKKEILEKDGYYIISVKSKNSQNKYAKSKTLYFDKLNNRIEKILVKDINNNEMVVIEYIKLEIF